MTIDYQKVLHTDVSFLTKYYYKKVGHIKNSFSKEVPQMEHYKLLTYLSFQFENALLIDAGTLDGISALCLAQNPTNHVITYDIEPRDLSLLGPIQYRPIRRKNISFRHMAIEKESVPLLLKSSLIFMDIGHTGVEERIVANLLIENSWNGYMVVDDLLRFAELAKWFAEIDVKKYDITPIGHATGTGLLDFANRGVQINTL